MSDFNKPKIHVSLKENKFHIKVFKKKNLKQTLSHPRRPRLRWPPVCSSCT